MTMYVITHKAFDYPLPTGYTPILVGADKNANPNHYQPDNEGENISDKNPSYCELTGLYWLWKNANDEYIGISHYRRYFSKYPTRGRMYLATIIKGEVAPVSLKKLDEIMQTTDWILSEPEQGGEGNVKQQFKNFHNANDLAITRQVISEFSPKVLSAFDQVMQQSQISFYNMFYTSKSEMDAYCEWLFKILFEVEKRTDIANYDQYQQRLYGFLSERLLNVWIKYRQVSVTYLAEYQTDELDRSYAIDRFKQKLKS